MARSLLTRRYVRRSQVQIAFLLAVGGLAVLHLPDCGAVGVAVAQHMTVAIGSYGTSLLAVTLIGSAVILGTPKSVWRLLTRTIVAAFASLTSRSTRIFRAAIRRDRARGADGGTTMASELPQPSSTPREQELRATLRHLGYRSHEIDSVLAKLDPSKEFPNVIRDAHRLLRTAPSLPT